jgi:hypothetical protein
LNTYRIVSKMQVGKDDNMATFEVEADQYIWPSDDSFAPILFYTGSEVTTAVAQDTVAVILKKPGAN